MALFETLTLSLGASIAKHILKSWLGDNLTNALLGDLVDVVKDEGEKASKNRESKQQIDRIGKRIVERLTPLFESEGIELEENQRSCITLELARTLSKAQITSKLLVDCNLDSQELAEKLKEVNPQATKSFSATESSIYVILLTETSKAIIEIATDLVSFQRQFASSILESQDQILDSIGRLLALPDERSQRYENEYLQSVSKNLDRLELFGVHQYDSVARKQSLSVAYIALEVNLPKTGQTKGENETAMVGLAEAATENKSKHTRSEKEVTYNASINDLLAFARRIVIRGYAGSGKTTLQRWIAVRSAARNFPFELASWNNTIPFLIPLREYVDIGFPELENFTHYVARWVGGKPDHWVHKQLDSGRAIILIDGVDV